MQRMDRYKAVIQQMLKARTAYRCYTTREELDALRAEQEAREGPLRWPLAPEAERPCRPPPWRPAGGAFPEPHRKAWPPGTTRSRAASIRNAELDDLIIARADGTPTYNFCGGRRWDMGITT